MMVVVSQWQPSQACKPNSPSLRASAPITASGASGPTPLLSNSLRVRMVFATNLAQTEAAPRPPVRSSHPATPENAPKNTTA